MKQRVIWGAIALAVFIPFLLIGGLPFQFLAGFLAMIGVSEMLRMKGLEVFSFEGALAMLGAFVLTVPLDDYLTSLPLDSSLSAYSLLMFILLAGTVVSSDTYSFDDAAYPIAASLYVGIGFQNLVNARLDSVNQVLFVLLIVWSTDIGAYLVGRRFGRRKLLPKVSPNKTVEGGIGGVVSAVVVAAIFMLVDRAVYYPVNYFLMLIYVVIFSVFGQFGDLVESAIKRHFDVKDSGKLIPGHGGILDRFDSMIFVFPIMHFFGLF